MARFWILAGTLLVCSLPTLLGIVFSYGDLGFYFTEVVNQFRAAATSMNWLWTKDLSSGYPLLANPQFNPIYLPDWLSLIPGPSMRGLTVNIMFHAWVGWIGFYTWARSRECSHVVSLWSGFLFAFHGAAASLQSMLDNFQFMVWIPWLMWSWSKLSGESPRSVLVFWGLAVFPLGAGEPQGCLLAGILAIPWILFDPKRSWLGLLSLVAAVLVQPWLFPFLEGVLVGDRAHGIRSMFDRPWFFNQELLFTLWSPSSLQSLSGANWTMGIRANWLQSLFIGAIVPWLCLTTWKGWSGRIKATLLLQLGLAYLATKSLPGASWVLESVPPFSLMRYPSRYVAFVPFIMLVLSLEMFRKENWGVLDVRLQSLVASLGAFLTVGFFALLFHGLLIDPVGSYFEWITIVASDLGVFASICALFLFGIVRKQKVILVLALSIDALWVGATYCRLTPWIGEFRLLPASFADSMKFGEGRWLDLSGPSTLKWGEVPRKDGDEFGPLPVDTTGMLPLAPVYRRRPFVLQECRNIWNTDLVMRPRGASVVTFNAFQLPLKDIENIAWHAGIDYSLTAANVDGGAWISPFVTYPGTFVGGFAHLGYRFMARRHESIPEVFFYSVLDTSEEYERAFALNPRTHPVAMIDSGACRNGGRPAKNLSWKQWSPTRWTIDLQGAAGVLVLAQEAYPGWKAIVDGRVRDAFRVNGIQMGACVDTTVKRVEFVYRPWWLYLLPLQLLIGLFLVPAVVWKKHIGHQRRHVASLQEA